MGGPVALAQVGRLQRGRQWNACFRQGKGGHPTKARSCTGAFPRSFNGVGHMTCASSHMACHQPAKWPPYPAMPNDQRPDARNPRGIFKTCIAWLVSESLPDAKGEHENDSKRPKNKKALVLFNNIGFLKECPLLGHVCFGRKVVGRHLVEG